ncbi:MAG: hypothetical protein A2Y25_01715 [Candidatus Melainabacteria bacterium GWF2_37_15]|nr:MAG: hypothetical protein A2Y25_01715 [Candidatus Melainabacteria bacterium GWF2_37_15]
MKNLLVHTCCATCAVYCLEKLTNEGWNVTGYFYNPNIHPESEYEKRKAELSKLNHKIIIQDEPSKIWFDTVKGFEQEKEGGGRCEICFNLRLEQTAIYAKENGFEAFTTVLTVSPHKNSSIINQIGAELTLKHQVTFLEENFKKDEGFKKTIELAKMHNFYRQNYCGCVYSI